ncbi:MAG: serine/threonine protein kinase [Bdellovibrionales bacterium]|nr:serine/threonine protein kinase [Bdellovibrionales bacterium]
MADEHLISLQPGTVIAGRYEVVKCLGAGSMGLVYACRHRELAGHMVAVKVLFPEVAQDKIAAARFRNEIFASYGVSHPNVVRAYEYLRDGDLVAYTMEYVDGGALADRLESAEDPLSIEEIVNYLAQMCCGVQAIHDAGIVHRDLKPENILLTKDEVVKIADFGIARTGHGPRLTEHGGVVGTIDYVSPEYMLNSQVDWRSDIYAIGILGYEMITGESPFRGDSVYATMTKRLKSDPEPPSSQRMECPDALDRIVLKAMNRDPEQRYQSAAEMFYELQEIMPIKNAVMGAVTSGAYMQIGKHGSASYVGPVVEELAQKRGSDIQASEAISTPYSAAIERNGAARHQPAAWEQAQALGSSPRARQYNEVEDTQILNPNAVNVATSYIEEDTIHEPVQMEQVLSTSIAQQDHWATQREVPLEVHLTSGGLDQQRMQRLSQLAENVNRSIWLDVVTSLVAVIIGVGVGVTLLRLYDPNMFSSSDTGQEYIDEERVDIQ